VLTARAVFICDSLSFFLLAADLALTAGKPALNEPENSSDEAIFSIISNGENSSRKICSVPFFVLLLLH
jgi:hypothetical protein